MIKKLYSTLFFIFSLFIFTATPSFGAEGFAVIHPDGHVCGVIVVNDPDPFGNGGKMPVEYMGCPSGSPIVMQTTQSATGNVAGFHGENVTYSAPTETFTITNRVINEITKEETVHTSTIKNGAITYESGVIADTGTGDIIFDPKAPNFNDAPQWAETATATITSEPTTALLVATSDEPQEIVEEAPVQQVKVTSKAPTKKALKKSPKKSKRIKKS